MEATQFFDGTRPLVAVLKAALAGFDGATVQRLEQGSRRHALRRSHEMAAATELLTELAAD
jgi:hypothetical protein